MPEDQDEAIGQQDQAAEGVTAHGAAEPRGLSAVPQSPLFEGRFGRMFRTLAFVTIPRETLVALGRAMAERSGHDGAQEDNPQIPAAYTYLGQFVDHDITFDPVSQLQRFNDPDGLRDFRTPRFDLDCVYGRGPADDPFLYEWTDAEFRGVKLLAGRNPDQDTDGTPLTRQDLPRNEQGRALIGDPRNDENIIVSQLQLAFIKFHDRLCDRVKAETNLTGSALYEETRRRTTWHYQWLVIHDFLVRIAGDAVVKDILRNEDSPAGPEVQLRFFSWENAPFMPVEFSAAAYRFGHSMVRPAYDLNDTVRDVQLFVHSNRPDAFGHLGGFRRLPQLWTIDWGHFVPIDGSSPQRSRRINTRIARPLLELPRSLDVNRNPLPVLNLRRGKALKLPSGQAVATHMGETPLTTAELGLGGFGLEPAQQHALEADTPLWYYVLKEAEARHDGQQLGPVGGRIVAEVLIGLLSGDPQSYLTVQPGWKPTGVPAATAGAFTLADFLKFATR
jgi:heme peroxidase